MMFEFRASLSPAFGTLLNSNYTIQAGHYALPARLPGAYGRLISVHVLSFCAFSKFVKCLVVVACLRG